LLTIGLSPLLATDAAAAPLTFRRTIELAARHSGNIAIAAADRQKAYQAYVETRSRYFPQMLIGSALGYSAGFPLSLEGAVPSLFNVTSQQALVNPAQRLFVQSAQVQWQASRIAEQEQQQQAVLRAAIAYAQLCWVNLHLQVINQQDEAAVRLVNIEKQRVSREVDTDSWLIRGRLAEARTRMRYAELEGTALELRKRLADLTGLQSEEIEPIPDSIPALPDETLPNSAEPTIDNDLQLQIATEQARASDLRARGERRLRWPTVDLVGQYALLSRFNNYDQFYRKFERNNATVGVVLRFSIFDLAQAAHARQSEAEAIKAHQHVDSVRSQVKAEVLRLQAAVRQFAAARDVAQLEYVLARRDSIKTDTLAEVGTAKLREQVANHIIDDEKFGALLEATFECQKAQFELLHAAGAVEQWAMAEALGHTLSSSSLESLVPRSRTTAVSGHQVSSPTVKTLIILPTNSALIARNYQQFAAVGIHDGGGIDITDLAKWSSSNESVAIVSTSGLVTALRAGHVIITATLSGTMRSIPITITEPPIREK
jgi:outer membrane protein TolC